MTDRPGIERYTLHCPCEERIIDGALVKVANGPYPMPIPREGARVLCPCGCAHAVGHVDQESRLMSLVAISDDEQIDAWQALGIDIAKVGCPHCDSAFLVLIPPDGINPSGDPMDCDECGAVFVIDGRGGPDGRELCSRALTDHEVLRTAYERWTRTFRGGA